MPAQATPLEVLASASEIQGIVAGMGSAIASAHPDGVALVAVLRGSVCLLADLARLTPVPIDIDFVAISSYAGGGGRVSRLLKDLDRDGSRGVR